MGYILRGLTLKRTFVVADKSVVINLIFRYMSEIQVYLTMLRLRRVKWQDDKCIGKYMEGSGHHFIWGNITSYVSWKLYRHYTPLVSATVLSDTQSLLLEGLGHPSSKIFFRKSPRWQHGRDLGGLPTGPWCLLHRSTCIMHKTLLFPKQETLQHEMSKLETSPVTLYQQVQTLEQGDGQQVRPQTLHAHICIQWEPTWGTPNQMPLNMCTYNKCITQTIKQCVLEVWNAICFLMSRSYYGMFWSQSVLRDQLSWPTFSSVSSHSFLFD